MLFKTLVIGYIEVSTFGPRILSRGGETTEYRDAVMNQDNAMQNDEIRVFGNSSRGELVEKVADIITMGDSRVCGSSAVSGKRCAPTQLAKGFGSLRSSTLIATCDISNTSYIVRSEATMIY